MEFSIKTEVIALLIIAILALFHNDRQGSSSRRYRLFSLCLLTSAVTIILNITASFALAGLLSPPHWALVVVNSAYFASLFITLSAMTGYAFHLLFEYLPHRRFYHVVIGVVMACGVLQLLLVPVNLWTGWLFSIRDMAYVRGPLNRLPYMLLLLELAVFCGVYLRHRSIMSRALRRMVQSLPLLLVLIMLIQVLSPDTLLSGCTSALACLIFFINFQRNRMGQDALTELFDLSTLFQEIDARRRQETAFHLILVHLEHFDGVNRKYGVRVGDALLYMVARYLDNFAPAYQAFRFSSTRFLLLGAYASPEASEGFVRTLEQRFSQPWSAQSVCCRLEANLAHMRLEASEQDENRVLEQLDYALTAARHLL